MSMQPAWNALQKLQVIARHIRILANSDIREDDIEALKETVREWAQLATHEMDDALVDIEVLLDAIEGGVDIATLKEYESVQQYARTG